MLHNLIFRVHSRSEKRARGKEERVLCPQGRRSSRNPQNSTHVSILFLGSMLLGNAVTFDLWMIGDGFCGEKRWME